VKDAQIKSLEALLQRGADSAVLRLTLASRYLADGRTEQAIEHAQAAVRLDPEYSAAWKALGAALAAAQRVLEAEAAYAKGIEVAERRGDQQAAKEMRVFLKRLQKSKPPGSPAA
jgi:predicted Zn-dependent protease